jgi:Zn-dependent peptidase ImmA (M78 family)
MKNSGEIYRLFDGKLVGRQVMREYVCETMTALPDEIIEKVTSACWFFASMDDAWAFTFTGNDLKDQHLIFLGDDLLTQDVAQIRYTILHEIGHVVLDHRNSVFVKQSEQEIARQEKEADEFVKTWLESSR